MYKNILVSTDGSELAMKGVDHALGLAKDADAKVTVITVSYPYPLQSAATFDSWNNAQRETAEKALREAKAAGERHGVEVQAHQAVNESAAEAIVDAAISRHCDLIVMASHGRRGMSRLLLGSQTSEVVSHSPIPVLVVR